MNERMREARELQRRELWIKVAVAVAGANDCKEPSVPINWANQAVNAFDKKFPLPAESNIEGVT